MTITRQDINNKIEDGSLSGRSFTLGVAVYELVRDGAELEEDIRSVLVDKLALLIDADYNKVDRCFTDLALVEAIDLAGLDEVISDYYGYDR